MSRDIELPAVRMDDYDAAAWAAIQAWKDRKLRVRSRRLLPFAVMDRAVSAGRAVRRTVRSVPRANRVETAFTEAMEGLVEMGFDAAMASVRTEAVLASYRRASLDVETLADIKGLSLAEIDRVKPNLALRYASAAMAEGATAGLLMTGGTALTPTGAGPAVVIGALAADTAATLMGGLRLVAHTAVYYGSDVPGDSDETVRATPVLGVAMAVGGANKAAAYRELSRVTQQLARRGWWSRTRELFGGTGTVPDGPVTKLITKILTQLGFKATAHNVEKALPVVGVGLGAGQNAALFRQIAVAADRLYRERWLIERYCVEPQLPDVPEDGDAVDIVGLIDQMRKQEEDDGNE